MTQALCQVLFLGLDPKNWHHLGDIYHYPLITTKIRSYDEFTSFFQDLIHQKYSHIIFTSKTTVTYFLQSLKNFNISLADVDVTVIAIGDSTRRLLTSNGIHVDLIADTASSESLVDLITHYSHQIKKVFYPCSALARTVIQEGLDDLKINYDKFVIYDTIFNKPMPLPNIKIFSKIVFTSPSTVQSFLEIWPTIPWEKEIIAIGPVTKAFLQKYR
ncbi:MAG: uroporphyrinogen-III synthase [Parachlamydiales bacterium]|nr:uroporphyrinogen-III synthase [Parachlamydiales bacterium]